MNRWIFPVAAVFGNGVVAVYDLEGKRAWARFVESTQVGFGHAASPLLLDGKVIVHLRDLVALDEALTALAAEDPRAARLVTLRYFGGLTIAEAARVLDISPATAKRDWAFARAWLQRALD